MRKTLMRIRIRQLRIRSNRPHINPVDPGIHTGTQTPQKSRQPLRRIQGMGGCCPGKMNQNLHTHAMHRLNKRRQTRGRTPHQGSLRPDEHRIHPGARQRKRQSLHVTQLVGIHT